MSPILCKENKIEIVLIKGEKKTCGNFYLLTSRQKYSPWNSKEIIKDI